MQNQNITTLTKVFALEREREREKERGNKLRDRRKHD